MNILVFQHLAVEHPGLFRDLWRAAGHVVRIVALDEGEAIPDLGGFDLLAVMGGPQDVWQVERFPWLAAEMAAIRDWVLAGRPYLGICLGHQLLAEAMGGKVGPMAVPEVGLTTVQLTEAGRADPVLGGLGPEVAAFQWHGAEVQRLPEGAEVLAVNAACQVQAMRIKRAWGIQFHIEMTETTVAEWSAVPEYRAAMERVMGPAAAGLAAELAPVLPDFAKVARMVDAGIGRVA